MDSLANSVAGGRHLEAIAQLDVQINAAQSDLELVKLLLNRAYLYSLAHCHRKAQKDYSQVLSKDGQNLTALVRGGKVLWGLKKHEVSSLENFVVTSSTPPNFWRMTSTSIT
jgi:hypothetical protein